MPSGSKRLGSEEKVISLHELIAMQDNLKKDIDFEKTDKELSQTELVKKTLYRTIDKTVEKTIGKKAKKNLDSLREMKEEITIVSKRLDKLLALGIEIERNFILQEAYLINHFKTDENNYCFLTIRKLNDELLNKDKSPKERVLKAQQILKIIEIYESKIVINLTRKQEIIIALLNTFENYLERKPNFDLINDAIENISEFQSRESLFRKWCTLSKRILKNREKALEAVQEDLEIYQIIPKQIIENQGNFEEDFPPSLPKDKVERMIKLAKESYEAQKEIEEERTEISLELFGSPSDYMNIEEIGKKEENKKISQTNNLEEKKWFRFLKVVYIIGWILGLGIVVTLSWAADDSNIFFIGCLIVWGIMASVKKAFFYIVLGNS